MPFKRGTVPHCNGSVPLLGKTTPTFLITKATNNGSVHVPLLGKTTVPVPTFSTTGAISNVVVKYHCKILEKTLLPIEICIYTVPRVHNVEAEEKRESNARNVSRGCGFVRSNHRSSLPHDKIITALHVVERNT